MIISLRMFCEANGGMRAREAGRVGDLLKFSVLFS